MITKFKSSKYIVAGLYRDLGSNTELDENSIIEWIGEALSLIGSYPQMELISTTLNVTNHTVGLPSNFVYPQSITYSGKPLSWSTKSALNNYKCDSCFIPTCCTEYNFYIKDNCLNTSLKEGQLCITYMAIPVDDEGYPLVPDNVYFDKALKAYCTYMIDKISFRKGTLTQGVFQFSEREWNFYVGSAKGSAYMPDVSQMEKIKRIWVRLIPKPNEFDNGFRNLANSEKRNIQ